MIDLFRLRWQDLQKNAIQIIKSDSKFKKNGDDCDLKIGEFDIFVPHLEDLNVNNDEQNRIFPDILWLFTSGDNFYISSDGPIHRSKVKFKLPASFNPFYCEPMEISHHLFSALKLYTSRKQAFVLYSIGLKRCILTCKVYLTEKSISFIKYANDFSKNSPHLQILLNDFMKIKPNMQITRPNLNYNRQKRDNFDELYSELTKIRQNFLSTDQKFNDFCSKMCTLNENLIPNLREYQKDAVFWMLWCEKSQKFGQNSSKDGFFENLYKEININGQKLYYNAYGGVLVREKPESPISPQICGGILADEMGLGKTVEILALILHNRCAEEISGSDLVSQSNVSFKRRKLTSDCIRKNTRKSLQPENDESESDFELSCCCDKLFAAANKIDRMKCKKCSSVQHKTCVNWVWENTDDYFCPRCRVEMAVLESKTTLIISPNTICTQWRQEIMNHVRPGALKVFVYEGVSISGFVQPKFLSSHDVVITTYETLRSELNYVDLPDEKRFRRRKRFSTFPSPITCLLWWRVCLDEAQMVEKASRAAEMCLKIESVHRWCVTGTPLQKSVQDFYGLLLFLGAGPYSDKRWWNLALSGPYFDGDKSNLIQTIAPYFWRTAKKDVLEQLEIPQQLVELCWVEFGPVEEHFYRRTREKCLREMNPILANWPDLNQKLDSLDREELEKFMKPLLKLRQACNHPQLMRENFSNLNKSLLTIEEVLEKMIKKTKHECEDEHRIIVSDYNGLAGLLQLKENWNEAARVYKRVLESCSIFSKEGNIGTDKLQMIHALRNLLEVNQSEQTCPLEPPPTVEENEELSRKLKQVEEEYLKKTTAPVTAAIGDFKEISKTTEELMTDIKDCASWWLEISRVCPMNETADQEMMNFLRNSGNVFAFLDANSVTRLRGLELVLTNQYDELLLARRHLVDVILRLIEEINILDPDFVESVSRCHLRTVGRRPLKNCILCEINRLIEYYEGKLFFLTRDAEGSEDLEVEDSDEVVRIFGAVRRVTRHESYLEQCLKLLVTFLSRNVSNSHYKMTTTAKDLISTGKRHLKLFSSLKKEYPTLTGIWTTVSTNIAARDELSMAAIKFRLKLPNEKLSPSDVHVISELEIDEMFNRLTNERAGAELRFRRKLGQFEYLTNLKKSENYGLGNKAECPICRNSLGFRWSMFLCGHFFCDECTGHLIKHSGPSLKCPVCRQEQSRNMISYVTSRRCWQKPDSEKVGVGQKTESSAENDLSSPPTTSQTSSFPTVSATFPEKVDFKFRGSYSSKIETVCRKLFSIAQNDPSAKSLVFSNWAEVLLLLGKALDENRIKFFSCQCPRRLPLTLQNFKTSRDVNILLIPTSFGANGLNIVEASHVLLVDPLLNPSVEQQVLGRVHRIGQTRNTYVHRFITRGTVEEKLYKILGDSSSEKIVGENQCPLTVADFVTLVQD